MLYKLCCFLVITAAIARAQNPEIKEKIPNANVQAQAQSQTVANRTTKTAKPGSRLAGASLADIANYKFTTAVYDHYEDSVVCYGAVLNSYWMVSMSSELDYYVVNSYIEDLSLYIGHDVLFDETVGIYRWPQEIIISPSPNEPDNFRNNIALTRFCPPVSSNYWAPALPAKNTMYSKGTMTTILNHNIDTEEFETASKPVGELCECDQISNWLESQHICLKESITVYTEYDDYYGLLVMINGKLAGYVLDYQDFGGEIVLNVSAFLDWISATAVTAPYDY